MDWYGKNISDDLLDRIKYLYQIGFFKKGTQTKCSESFLIIKSELRSLLCELYSEFGLKAIVKMLNDPIFTYSSIRYLFRRLDIPFANRTCTDDLKRVRAINARNKKNFVDWTSKFNQERGVQGYYQNKLGEYYWLRSSWEYGYAKFINTQTNLIWRAEVQSYLTSQNKTYRPDFFIYDIDNNLLEIVEIKSTYFLTSQERIDKALLASKEFDLNLKIYTQDYLKNLFDLNEILPEWKKVRLLKKDIDKNG